MLFIWTCIWKKIIYLEITNCPRLQPTFAILITNLTSPCRPDGVENHNGCGDFPTERTITRGRDRVRLRWWEIKWTCHLAHKRGQPDGPVTLHGAIIWPHQSQQWMVQICQLLLPLGGYLEHLKSSKILKKTIQTSMSEVATKNCTIIVNMPLLSCGNI